MAKQITNDESTIQRVGIYIRYSALGGRDVESITTMTTQESECRSFCGIRKWEVVKVFADPGRSAFKKGTPRPEYDEALAMIQSGQIDAIVVWKVDRFTRSLAQFVKDWNAIQEAGGHFVSVVEQFDTSIPMGRLMLNLCVGFAELESEMKRDRAIPMHRHHKESGKAPGGPRPYGYDRTPGDNGGSVLTIKESEADLIRMAAQFIIDEGTLAGFIHKYQPDSTHARKELTNRGLKHVLMSPTTAGKRSIDDGFVDGCWPAILDEATWLTLRECLGNPKRKTTNGNQVKYLLSGILTCGRCGGHCYSRSWTHRTSRVQTMRYQCHGCSTSMDMQAIDSIVMARLADEVPQAKWEAWKASGMGWDPETIKGIERKLALVDKQWNAGKLSDDRWLTMTAELNEQHDRAINNEPLDLPDVSNLWDSWEAMPLLDRRKVLTQAFRSVKLNPMNGIRDPKERVAFETELVEATS